MEEEVNYLAEVQNVIEKIIESYNLGNSLEISDINEMKRFLWDNFSDYNDGERFNALNEIEDRVSNTNIKIDEVKRYNRAIKSPYFGKIVFKDQYDDEGFNVYIGMCSVQEKLNFYVFDWRAPISSLFYNFEVGKAYYNTPNGVNNGTILSKMQYKIIDGKMVRCFSSDLNIDDEFLQEVLSAESGDKMKNIVSTIQREQNLIIRDNTNKDLIVQGVAGSGKTSVALHRIAYLLYQNQNLGSRNILVFSPNEVFSDYISDVLPELGEENVMTTTFSDLSETYLNDFESIESFSSFLDRVYNLKNKSVLDYKMSDEFMEDLNKYVNDYFRSFRVDESVIYRGTETTPEEIACLFHKKYSNLNYEERIDEIVNYICDKSRYSSDINSVALKKYILDHSNIVFNPYYIYNGFIFSNYCKLSNRRSIAKDKLRYEDIMPLLYIKFMVNGYPNHNEIREIIIDEAQDYSKSQYYLLRKIFKKATFTILGDVNQTINPCYKYDSLKCLDEIFESSSYLELNKSYRSSEQIIDYSNKILCVNNSCSVRHNNEYQINVNNLDNEEAVCSIMCEMVDMQKSGLRRIAIITKNSKEAEKINEKLKVFNRDIQLVDDRTTDIESDVIIIPSYLAKGLEFDSVIVYNDKYNNYTEAEKYLYYVVCTRAQHSLSIYNEPSFMKKKGKMLIK